MKQLLLRFASWRRFDWTLVAVAVLLLGGALVRTAFASSEVYPGVASGEGDRPQVPQLRDALPQTEREVLLAAVAVDPFRPDRSAAPRRYRPGDQDLQDGFGQRALARRATYRLLGIAVAGDLRLAIIDASGQRPGVHSYRAGDSIGPFVLTVLAGDSVVLAGADTSVVLKIIRPWEGDNQ